MTRPTPSTAARNDAQRVRTARVGAESTAGVSEAPGPPQRAKYGNRKVSLDGYTFDSRAEGNRYVVLREKLRTGEIMDLEVHPSYRLDVNGQKVCRYEADFSYHDPETYAETVEDVKSPITRKNRDYRIKVKLMQACHGIRVQEILP